MTQSQQQHDENRPLSVTCHVSPLGGVVVPPHVSAPKRHSQRARWSISGAHPFGAVCPPGLGCSRAHGGPLGRASCPPCGASGRRPCRPSAIAPPRPLGAALRVGAWPCGAGVSVLKVAPAYSGAEYKPGPGNLCDLVRVSGVVSDASRPPASGISKTRKKDRPPVGLSSHHSSFRSLFDCPYLAR